MYAFAKPHLKWNAYEFPWKYIGYSCSDTQWKCIFLWSTVQWLYLLIMEIYTYIEALSLTQELNMETMWRNKCFICLKTQQWIELISGILVVWSSESQTRQSHYLDVKCCSSILYCFTHNESKKMKQFSFQQHLERFEGGNSITQTLILV